MEFKLQQIPVAAVVKELTPGKIGLGIAAGSEIDETTLLAEVSNLEKHGHHIGGRLFIDSQATRIEYKHVIAERGGGAVGVQPGGEYVMVARAHGEDGLTKRIGSTGKGIGAARAARIMREAKLWDAGQFSYDVADIARRHLKRGHTVMIEGTQGFGLGLHAGYYPYCTSSDCRAVDFAAMAGVSPWADASYTEVWIAIRTFPIRVAGNSGPLENETSWAEIGEPEERTTVTNKVRRVARFDPELVRRAIEANGGVKAKLALMFYDYLVPDVKNSDKPVLRRYSPKLVEIEEQIGHQIEAVGTGPKTIAGVY